MIVSWTASLFPPFLLLFLFILHFYISFSSVKVLGVAVPRACPNPNPFPDPGVWH